MADWNPSLLKLHGDTSGYGRVLTSAEYTLAYSEGGNLPSALTAVFAQASALFLGCSLNEDRTMNLLHEMSRKAGSGSPVHYAVLAKPDTGGLLERTKFLSMRRILPIWFQPGKYEQVEAILTLLHEVAEENEDYP